MLIGFHPVGMRSFVNISGLANWIWGVSIIDNLKSNFMVRQNFKKTFTLSYSQKLKKKKFSLASDRPPYFSYILKFLKYFNLD